MRYFNIAGPCNKADHYMTNRLNAGEKYDALYCTLESVRGVIEPANPIYAEVIQTLFII